MLLPGTGQRPNLVTLVGKARTWDGHVLGLSTWLIVHNYLAPAKQHGGRPPETRLLCVSFNNLLVARLDR